MNAQDRALSESSEEHRRFLYRYALARVRHKDTAEEVVQETLLAALEGHANFRGDSSLRTWLTSILKHKITDHQRREARDPVRVGALTPADLDGEIDEEAEGQFTANGEWVAVPSAWPSPERSFENARFWETFERCLARLPPAMGRAFYLREVQGLSTDEICAEFGITPNNCWVMLYRARMKLRQDLEEHWFDSGKCPTPAVDFSCAGRAGGSTSAASTLNVSPISAARSGSRSGPNAPCGNSTPRAARTIGVRCKRWAASISLSR